MSENSQELGNSRASNSRAIIYGRLVPYDAGRLLVEAMAAEMREGAQRA